MFLSLSLKPIHSGITTKKVLISWYVYLVLIIVFIVYVIVFTILVLLDCFGDGFLSISVFMVQNLNFAMLTIEKEYHL